MSPRQPSSSHGGAKSCRLRASCPERGLRNLLWKSSLKSGCGISLPWEGGLVCVCKAWVWEVEARAEGPVCSSEPLSVGFAVNLCWDVSAQFLLGRPLLCGSQAVRDRRLLAWCMGTLGALAHLARFQNKWRWTLRASPCWFRGCLFPGDSREQAVWATGLRWWPGGLFFYARGLNSPGAV